MDHLEALHTADAEFRRRLVAITDDQWRWKTPCEAWTVRDLVNHLVAVAKGYTLLLSGASIEAARGPSTIDNLGNDPVGAFTVHITLVEAAFKEDGALDRTCDYASYYGVLTGAQLLDLRVLDVTLHAWDLARALGADEHLDDELVRSTWQILEPLLPTAVARAWFREGPSGNINESHPLQIRLLDAAGRRP